MGAVTPLPLGVRISLRQLKIHTKNYWYTFNCNN